MANKSPARLKSLSITIQFEIVSRHAPIAYILSESIKSLFLHFLHFLHFVKYG